MNENCNGFKFFECIGFLTVDFFEMKLFKIKFRIACISLEIEIGMLLNIVPMRSKKALLGFSSQQAHTIELRQSGKNIDL